MRREGPLSRAQEILMLFNVGPDQLIPFYGLLGAAAGMALIFWERLAQGLRLFAAKWSALRRHA